MMISETTYHRITDFYYRVTASEELITTIEEELLQAMWDSEEQITEDELVQLAFELIRKEIH
ncbi:hypothetical protein KQI58_18925 [Enterococcus raffinosus]|uniref:hypothetical protein n=1 Tax=Enterococcus raffinosus TaxID=71452 RepID=UPI001C0FBAF2|nr:hypothetical protein [Enterococcus raffinosus]MBU5363123.1 hypothetical protein [Enterococcus raffinosus]